VLSSGTVDSGPVYPQGRLRRWKPHFTKEKIGTRYVLIGIRTLVNPTDPKDLEVVHALQDAIKVDQLGGPRRFEGTKPLERLYT
jgi:hypothetical protein